MADLLKVASDGDVQSLKEIEDSEKGETDLLKAAGDGNLEYLKEIEASKNGKGWVAAARGLDRCAALHFAAGQGHTEVCKYLIEELGVEVDPRDIHGETPLYKAIVHGHIESVRYLLIKEANPHVKCRLGVTTLHQAAALGNLELITILIANGVELNSQCYMGTPLACAIKSRSFDCFKALIQADADVPKAIMYPLHFAAQFGSIEIVTWFLEARYDPNAFNDGGWRPIQLAAYHNNLEVVEFLLSRTTQFLDLSNWTVPGVMEEVLQEIGKRVMEHASTEEAALQGSQFVQIGRNVLSDKVIEEKLAEMLLTDEYAFFEGWSPMKKRLFFESTSVKPPSLRQISDHGFAGIQNSVICDLTNPHKAQASYLRAIHVYRAWHFSGSDVMYEIGPRRKRFCASRKDQTFVFWYRYLHHDVGLVIDGQSVWVEGMLRRTRKNDGSFKYASPIQFRREDDSSSSSSSSSRSKQKSVMKPLYIVDGELVEADYGGNYAGSVSNMKFSIDSTRCSVITVSEHDKKKSFHRHCHGACDNLVFFATEAGKNLWAFEYTMHALDPKLVNPIAVPSCFNGTVTNHQQVSRNVLSVLQTTAGEKLKDLPRGGYDIVTGAVFRTMWQCLNAYVILRRKAVFKSRFFLAGKELEYRRQVKNMVQRHRHESDEQFAEREREENVRRGTLFDPDLHSGFHRHKLSICPQPLKPSRKRWYHADEPSYH